MSATSTLLVVGAGVSGLAAAHRACELLAARGAPPRVTVLEAGARAGGVIATERRGDLVIETGADSFLTEKPWALALCRRLGLEDQLIGTRAGRQRTYVVHGGRLHALPEGFVLLAPTRLGPIARSTLFSLAGKLRMAADLVLPRRTATTDESLASFVTRRLGREALERVAQPLAGGIYTADPHRLSMAATMPRFVEMERRHRSLILAMRRQARAGAASGSGARWTLFASPRDGMQTLTDTLASRLPEGALRLGARVTAVARAGDGWQVGLAGGETLAAERLVLAAPAFVAGDLLRPLDPGLATALVAIDYASSAVVVLEYARRDVPHPLDGFGIVVPAIEGRRIIACSFLSVKYPGRAPEDRVLIRVFCGGALAADVVERSDRELLDLARAELGALLGIRAAPALEQVWRHPRAMPQYAVGHLERVAAIERAVSRHPGLALAGGAYRGVGIPDCVHSGEAAAERLLGEAAAPAA